MHGETIQQYRMKAHAERCSGITVKSSRTLDINVNTSSWKKWKHNELKSTSSSDAQGLLSMAENDSNGNAGKKQKVQCDLSLSHASSASFFRNNSRHEDVSGVDRLVRNAKLCKNVHKAVFGIDLMKLKQETRSIRSRALSKEEIDFHL